MPAKTLHALLSRFIAPNGRCYLGRLIKQDKTQATIQFEHPSEPYMLHNLQVSNSALQPHQPQPSQSLLSDLPPGSTVFVRLAPHSLYERSELQGIDSAKTRATVTIVSSGAQHHVPVDQVIQAITLDDDDAFISDDVSGGDVCSDDDRDSNDMPWSGDEAEVEDGPTHHNSAALAVLDADLAASKVHTVALLMQRLV